VSLLDSLKCLFGLAQQPVSQQPVNQRADNRQVKDQPGVLNGGKLRPVTEDSAPTTHEDFAGALSLAVDSLQSQLSQMSNQVSDFGLREISVQAKVILEVTPLGVLTYKFIKPGDQIDAQAISTLSLTVVPVPKGDLVGTLSPGKFNGHSGVEEIPGITKDNSARLRELGIFTASDFFKVGTRVRSAVRLAALLDVERQQLNEWLAHAQLLMLEGINGKTATILIDAGISNINDLASLTPEQVMTRYKQQADTQGSSAPRLALTQVEQWIKTARSYTGTPDTTVQKGDLPRTEHSLAAE